MATTTITADTNADTIDAANLLGEPLKEALTEHWAQGLELVDQMRQWAWRASQLEEQLIAAIWVHTDRPGDMWADLQNGLLDRLNAPYALRERIADECKGIAQDRPFPSCLGEAVAMLDADMFPRPIDKADDDHDLFAALGPTSPGC